MTRTASGLRFWALLTSLLALAGCGDDDSPRCGNGVLDNDGVDGGGEQCDDGNGDDGDSCTNACVVASCGDGVVWRGVEACDDGNDVDDDGCTNECTSPTCGDGGVQEGRDPIRGHLGQGGPEVHADRQLGASTIGKGSG